MPGYQEIQEFEGAQLGSGKSLYTFSGFRQFYLVKGMRSLALTAMASAVDDPEERSGVLAAARSGDLPAFERLMRQYERLVLVTALRLAGNLPDAQDVSQDVFLKLYRNLGKLTSEEAVASWLYRVTVNACHDLRRRRRPEDPMEHSGQARVRRR